jgi:asparagine synthase (glutamine-hydrolysing)
MSGIAVLLSRDGRPADERSVAAMLAAIPYRGPDGMRVLVTPEVVLGHARLAVTTEHDVEHQPLVSPRTGCAVVADARLDNRQELISLLAGCPPSASDADLILRAYETWGLAAPERLLGDFAFAVWDPAAGRLVCARDGAGQRSLYYRQDHRVFAAASELHQLLQDPAVPVAPNDQRIREALVPANVHRNEKDRADTYYTGISSVLAGQMLVVDQRSLRSWQYWRLEPPPELRYKRRADYAEQFRSLLFEAVRARLRTSRPLGAMLSGGLDSTSIVCAAQELFGAGRAVDTGFATLSIVYDGLECDERPLIEATQHKYGFAAHFLAPDLASESPAEGKPGFRERPTLATSGFDTLLREASHLGMRTVLTGEIGDACVRGSPLVLDSLLKAGRLGDFWRYLHAYRALSRDPWRKILALYVVAPLAPLSIHRRLGVMYERRVHARAGRYAVPAWMPDPLREALADRHLEILVAEEGGRQSSSESRHWDLLGLCPPEAMILPAGWPLQLARPFADRRLQEFLLAVPPPDKFEPHPTAPDFYAGSKQLIRRGLAGILPEPVRTRTGQTHFASAVVERIRHQWPALTEWFGPGARSRAAERGYVDRDRFWERLQHLRDGRLGMDCLHLGYCLSLESWLRSLEQPRQQAVTVRTAWTDAHQNLAIDRQTASSTVGGSG